MSAESTILNQSAVDIINEPVVFDGPSASEVEEANETHDYKRPGKVRMYGYTLLTAIGAQAALVSGAFGGNKARESQPLVGENQVVLVNFIPSDHPELKNLDSAICDHAEMQNAFMKNSGFPGMQYRYMTSIDNNGGCKFQIRDVYMSVPDSSFSSFDKAQTTFFAELSHQSFYKQETNGKQQNNIYWQAYYGGQTWWNQKYCSVTYKANSGQLSKTPGDKNLGVERLNADGCDRGDGIVPKYGFLPTEPDALREMASNFGIPDSNDPKDIMFPDLSHNWTIATIRQNGDAFRRLPYFSWQIDASSTGPGTVTSRVKPLGPPTYPNYPGGALDTRQDGTKAAPGDSTLVEDAHPTGNAKFVRWDVEAPNPANGPDFPPFSSAPYETVNIPNPTNPHLEIANVDRSYRIQAIFAANASKNKKLGITVNGHGAVRAAGGIAVVNSLRSTADVMRHSFNIPPTRKTVALYEKPADGEKFAGWTGACHGLVKKCVVVMNANKAVSARFVKA